VGQKTKPIHVIDDVVADFTFATGGIIVDFTSISTTADSLFWDFGDGNTGGDSLTIQHNYDSLGTFDVWLYAYNECGVDSIMYQVTTDDVGFEKESFDFGMYPNPANTEVSISGLTIGSRIEVINILGETIITINVNQEKEKINLNDLSNGTYFIRLSGESNQLTKKLIVRH
jgi:PKD repeat protein